MIGVIGGSPMKTLRKGKGPTSNYFGRCPSGQSSQGFTSAAPWVPVGALSPGRRFRFLPRIKQQLVFDVNYVELSERLSAALT